MLYGLILPVIPSNYKAFALELFEEIHSDVCIRVQIFNQHTSVLRRFISHTILHMQ